MNFYENIFILSPDLDDSAVENSIERVKNIVIKNGGEIIKIENWGRKKLAYELNKQSKGIYILLIFKAPPATIHELEKLSKVFDVLIKFMAIKLRKKQIEAVLSSLQEAEKAVETKTSDAAQEAKKAAETQAGDAAEEAKKAAETQAGDAAEKKEQTEAQ
jgi:small subunit ribosomal protein S6